MNFVEQLTEHIGGKSKKAEQFDEFFNVNEYLLLNKINKKLVRLMDLDLILGSLKITKDLDKIEALAIVMQQQSEYLDIKVYNY